MTLRRRSSIQGQSNQLSQQVAAMISEEEQQEQQHMMDEIQLNSTGEDRTVMTGTMSATDPDISSTTEAEVEVDADDFTPPPPDPPRESDPSSSAPDVSNRPSSSSAPAAPRRSSLRMSLGNSAHTMGEPRWGMRDPLNPAWTKATQALHGFLGRIVTNLSLHAVRNPKTYISIITLLGLTLVSTGFFTNFILVLDLDVVFTPVGSLPSQHNQWIISDDGFPNETRNVQMIFHAHGANVLQHVSQARRVLQAVDTVRTTDGYYDLCSRGVYKNFDNEVTCRIMSMSGFWKNHSLALFDEQVGNDNDNLDSMLYNISQKEFADGSPVLHDLIVGNYERNPTTKVLQTAQSFMIQIELPNIDGKSDSFESKMLSNLARMRNDWLDEDKDKHPSDPTLLTVDIMTIYAFQSEILRTIIADLYLIPICLFLMVGFTCAIFYRRHDRVQSRAMLGLCSVVTIVMSVSTAFGIMFLVGVPYSAVHQMLPFVIFGIGLDDTFIITGAYFRTDPNDPIEERIRQTMQEIGPSITLTTFTTVFAFMLGYLTSSLPGVHWLCLYAMATIAIDFYYQITYFVAFVVLDERRIKANKKDCCFWQTYEDENGGETDKDHASDKDSEESSSNLEEEDLCISVGEAKARNAAAAKEDRILPLPLPVRLMQWYSEFLMRPYVKIAVLAIFAGFFGLMCYSASQLEQHFNVADYVASDSYLSSVFASLDDYSSVVRPMGVYFRNIDQMDADTQRQMIEYVEELERLDQIGVTNVSLAEAKNSDEVRPFCWVRDLQEIEKYYTDPTITAILEDMTFSQKLDFAMNDKVFREVYGSDIIRDESGDITASRCFLFLKNLDLEDVHAQVDMLFDQRAVSAAQPVNQLPEHQNEWAMFSFNDLFFYWEAYAVAVNELVLTIITGVISVTVISFIFIPHWSAACFVLPTILVLYIDLLGTVRYFGLNINGLTYICVVVAIGLLVDFLMHILLRYYEARPDQTREARVKEVLQTMGVSILVGGFTTFLGVLPLCLSSVEVFLTVFYAFFAMVALGVSHGLILLPVILSYVGPTMCVRGHHLATPPDFPTPSLSAPVQEAEADLKTNDQCCSFSGATNDASVDTSAGTETPSGSGIFNEDSWRKHVTDEIEV